MNWKNFWETKALSGGPALQVGRVVSGKVLDDAWIARIAARIAVQLDLQKEDSLLDVCCGNGALSRALLPYCKQIVGVDFSENLIRQAQNFEGDNSISNTESPIFVDAKSSENAFGSDREKEEMKLGKGLPKKGVEGNKKSDNTNIKYVCGDAATFSLDEQFDKICLYFSFQYFESVSKGEEVISNLLKHAKPGARILLGDIPDQRKFFVYYNSPRKISSWLKQSVTGKNDMGKFWHPDELLKICNSLGVKASVIEQESWQPYSQYRFDFLLEING